MMIVDGDCEDKYRIAVLSIQFTLEKLNSVFSSKNKKEKTYYYFFPDQRL